jgi:hypothetical protein
VGPNGQGTVTGVTDVNGQVGIIVVGSVDQATYASNGDFPEPDRQTPSPGEQFYFGCVTVNVTAPGFPPTTFPSMIASALDHELVAPGVGSGDLSRAIADLDSGNYRERSDYDTNIAAGGAGQLNSADLSVMISFFSSSVSSCTPSSGGPCP